NKQCTVTGVCDVASGYCFPSELDCNNYMDDDLDYTVDCEDTDCLMACAPQLSAACGAAVPAQASNQGDTKMGTRLFGASCGGTELAAENVYSFTPGVAGQVGQLTV